MDFGGWKTPIASRKNDDGTVSLALIAPGSNDGPFVVGRKDGKPTLVIHDMQHEYVFVAAD